MVRLKQAAAALVCAGAIAVGSASAQVTIGTIGNASNGTTFPFGFSAGYTKFQQIYSSSLFSGPFGISSVSFYTKPGTEILQQGTYNFSFSQTTVAPVNVNTGNPAANETGPRQAFGSLTFGAGVDAPGVVTVLGTTYNFNPAAGNLVLNVDFIPIGNFVQTPPRAAFDQYFDVPGTFLVATSSDPQALFGGTAGIRGRGLVTTFGTATVVPEPSSVFLMAAGMAGVAFAARRRRLA